MLFSSMTFLWIFLPITLIGNFLLGVLPFKSQNKKISAKNLFLLIMSFIFYAWGGIYYLLIMVASIVINFFGAFIIEKKAPTQKKRKLFLVLVIILNLGMLFFFKYFNMLVAMIESFMTLGDGVGVALNNLFNLNGTGELGIAKIVLPIGISFFTFQSMSYVFDVYTKKTELQENILDFALYVSLFPQLIAGPIVKYGDVALQLKTRTESLELFCSGIKKFCYGLAKKVLLSNTFASIADSIWKLDTATIGAPMAWLGVIAYTMQIYYDFSGYSDMAIGLGRMFGFRFKENFNYPYTALSIREFWQRWHISLSSWFKEYVYIPLGGNRKGLGKTCRNIFIIFLLTGVWHGANFTFIFWGLMYAVLQILERLFLGKWLDKNPIKIFNWLYTILFVMIGWVFFRSTSLSEAFTFIGQMFSFSSGTGGHSVLSELSMMAIIMFVIGILASGLLQRPLKKIYEKHSSKTIIIVIDFALQFILLALCILFLVGGTYNPFIYFQF